MGEFLLFKKRSYQKNIFIKNRANLTIALKSQDPNKINEACAQKLRHKPININDHLEKVKNKIAKAQIPQK